MAVWLRERNVFGCGMSLYHISFNYLKCYYSSTRYVLDLTSPCGKSIRSSCSVSRAIKWQVRLSAAILIIDPDLIRDT